MKPLTIPITSALVEDYAEKHTSPEDAVLHDIYRWAHLHTPQPRMASGHYQGRLLQTFSEMIRPKRAIEIGCFVGYSTICIARGLCEEGRLDAIEVNEEYEDIILKNLNTANLTDKVKLHIGNALEVIPRLGESYDLAFIDADKPSSKSYYDMLVPKMNKGGVILIDNILWSGKVLVEQPRPDHDTDLIKELNDYIQADKRVENILLPIRDGLMLCRIL